MIRNLLVLGAGSAGLIAALSIKRKIPTLNVRIVRSPELGVIGVGEGTTPNFPRHLFDDLGISRKRFYQLAEPTWKLGIRFLWGSRGRFDYAFSQQLDAQWSDLPRPNGFFCDEEFASVDLPSSLMRENRVFPRQSNGAPDLRTGPERDADAVAALTARVEYLEAVLSGFISHVAAMSDADVRAALGEAERTIPPAASARAVWESSWQIVSVSLVGHRYARPRTSTPATTVSSRRSPRIELIPGSARCIRPTIMIVAPKVLKA